MGPNESQNSTMLVNGEEIHEIKTVAWCECDPTPQFSFYQNLEYGGKLKMRKYSRKKFKKYLMSLRVSRDFAEKQCDLVASYKGALSYNTLLFYSVSLAISAILFGKDDIYAHALH